MNNLDYNFRGQLTKIDRVGANVEDTVLTYHPASANFQLYQIKHGVPNEGIPDFWYTEYDPLGQLKKMETYYTGTVWENYTFTYDAVGRLASEKRVDSGSATAYHYTYTYGLGGNIATRKNESNGATRSYFYDNDDAPPDGRHYHALESVSGDGISGSYSYTNDPNGNMTGREDGGGDFTQAFDAENRLQSVAVGGQTTYFYYDADGNRILSVLPGGTKVYTPFPEYEKTVPTTGSATERIHYYLGGQYIAVRVRVGTTGDGTLRYAYGDHLGSVSAWSNDAGVYISNSIALFEPYGGYRFRPPASVNPGISDWGFTGHRHNNAETNDIGLIYMNARYYLPEVGRFISADTIVPEPQDSQSYNRYSYTRNDPINLTDPSGHRECIDQLCDIVLNEQTQRPVMRGPLPMSIRYIHSEMIQNATSATAAVIRGDNLIARYSPSVTSRGFAYGVWMSQVMDARVKRFLGPFGKYVANWDHKPILMDDQNSPVPEIAALDGWSTVGSNQYRFDIWSNIHYGYVGTSSGFPAGELTGGAGLEQIGTDVFNSVTALIEGEEPSWPSHEPGSIGPASWDDPSDTASIEIGANLWRQYGLAVTPADIYVAVIDETSLAHR